MTRTQYTALFVLFLAVIAVIIFIVWWNRTQNPPPPAPVVDALVGDGAAVYTYLDGTPVALESFFGKPLLVNSWASWSPLSRDELIALNEIAGQYPDETIEFIALNRKETKEQAARFLSTLPPLPNLTIIIDTNDYFYNRVGGYAMPETIVFDATGTLVVHERNPQTLDSLRALLTPLVAEPPTN